MSLASGSQLGPYEILSPIGAGGMGEVYQARDTRLDRTVAIKVLPEHLSNDPARRERFEREARAVSSLNHPHICTLHEFDTQDGIDFIVMEYIEGETLADRLKKGPLELGLALEYGVQIADALDKAHGKGIVHRDLKPGNIMLTKPGVKLLDFGLAKASPTRRSLGEGGSDLPTQQKPLTGEGAIVGTLQYMAPEQLEGQEADARTDVFALGAVLYEMITGRKAFEGSSQASLITAIMSCDPPAISELQSMSPQALDHVVKKCLAKDPDDRWHSAHDLAGELQWIATAAPETPVLQGERRTLAWPWVAALVVALVGVSVWAVTRSYAPPASPVRLSVAIPSQQRLVLSGNTSISVALSRDGQRLAYVAEEDGTTRVYLRTLGAFEAEPVPGTEGAAIPFFSADGEWLGFHRNRQLQKISLSGGAPVTICDAPTVLWWPTWGADDTIIFSRGTRSGLFRVHADGGTPETLTTPDIERGEVAHSWPYFLPDGRKLLFTARTESNEFRLAMLALDSGEWQHISGLSDASTARYTPSAARGAPGHLIFLRSGSLVTQSFDVTRLQPVGAPIELGDVLAVGQAAQYDVSETGSLAFVPGLAARFQPGWVDRSGKRQGEPLDVQSTHPSLAPDGGRLAVAWNGDIWILDLARGTRLRLTADGVSLTPAWSPDGTAVVFRKTGTTHDIVRGQADGSGEEELLHANRHSLFVMSFSPDGNVVAYEEENPETGRDLWLLPLEGEPEPFLVTPFNESGARFSPDGSLVAYVSDETGGPQVYLRRYPRGGAPLPISASGGAEPVWSRKGDELFYRNGDQMMAVTVTTEPTLDAGEPRLLFEAPFFGAYDHAHYDVSPDGERFMMVASVTSAPSQINVVLNWAQELERAASED